MAPAPEREVTDATVAHGAIPLRTFASGRYEAMRALPEGGQKIVYLVRDTVLDRECALSLIKPDQLQAEDLERLRREAQAMARLGTHAQLVTIFDIGDEGGRPYIVSEFVAGGELRQEMRAAAGPLALDRALSVTRDVALALAFAHARGIVHRDIKPANIWLTEDGAAKLGDFGLAFGADRSRLTQDGTFVGTAAYIAPEQALGGAADARSDLYALGCVLYEMVTGRVPFAGDDMVSVISQHIETAPVAPSWHNGDVSSALDALILQLLAKSPEDRPQSAGALLAEFDTLTSTSVPQVAEAPPANPLARLAAGVFVGRDREVGELRRGLDHALSGRGQLMLIVGEPGIGKTRTASELCTYARLRGAQVLTGRCYEGDGAPAYWPWMQAIRSYVAECDSGELQSEMGDGAVDIAQMVSEVHSKLPGLPPPPTIDPDHARFRLFESLTTFLKNASRRQPLVLLLDDLHWADKASLLMLQFLARDLTGARLLVLGTYRDGELGRQHPLGQTLAELARGQVATRVLLHGLGAPDVARYIEMTAAIAPSDALVAAVFRETEGNPFFLSEVVRLLAADGRLQDGGNTGAWTMTFPQSAREVVGRRLSRLSDDCNRMLTTVAAATNGITWDVLRVVTGYGEEQLLDLLDEAVDAQILRENGEGRAAKYEFAHALIRHALYGELRAPRRIFLQRKVAEAIEEVYAGNIGPHLTELAYLFGETAADPDEVTRAVRYARSAGDREMLVYGYEEAQAIYERALTLVNGEATKRTALQLDLLADLTLAQRRGGDPAKAEATLALALHLAKLLGSPEHFIRLASELPQPLTFGKSNELHIEILESALAAAKQQQAPETVIRLMALLATEYSASGGPELTLQGVDLSEEALQRAETLGEPELLLDAISARYATMMFTNDLPARNATSYRMFELAAQTNNRFKLYIAHDARSADLLESGDLAGAGREIQELGPLSEELRDPLLRLNYLGAAFTYELLRGRLDEAASLRRSILSEPGTNADTYTVAVILANQPFPLAGESPEMPQAESALRGFIEAKLPAMALAHSMLAHLYAECSRVSKAREEIALALADGWDGIVSGPVPVFCLARLASASIAADTTEHFEILYDALSPYASWHVANGNGSYLGPVARYLGVLAAAMERWAQAEHWLGEAVSTCLKADTPPWLAQAQYDYSSMLTVGPGRGDLQLARNLLGEALTTTRRIGMTALQGKIEAAQTALAART